MRHGRALKIVKLACSAWPVSASLLGRKEDVAATNTAIMLAQGTMLLHAIAADRHLAILLAAGFGEIARYRSRAKHSHDGTSASI